MFDICASDAARLIVSAEQLDRALRIMQALLTHAERRGYTVRPSRSGERPAGARIVAGGREYRPSLVEKCRRRRLTEVEREHYRSSDSGRWYLGDPPKTIDTPTGQLRLRIPGPSGLRGEWADGPRGPLEAKLATALEAIERYIAADDEVEMQRELQRRQWEVYEEYRRLQREQREQQRRRAESLHQQADAWARARLSGEYIAALKTRLPLMSPENQVRVQAWTKWAEDHLRGSDPVTNPELIRSLDDI
jgi:hypothetical protein